MKVVLTGSLGHISRPLAAELLAKGHTVTIISSKAERHEEIEAIGAEAAIGSVLDADFLAKTFEGADIAYLMEPPFNFFDHSSDAEKFWLDVAGSYAHAILQSGITKVIHLSSIGGHTDQGVGMLAAHHRAEKTLQALPNSVCIKTMRPVGFYYNMFAFIPTIRTANAIFQNYGGDEIEPWVSPIDIASVIAEEIELPFDERKVRYIASDEVSPNEAAEILGEAINKPDLKWKEISDIQFETNLKNAGFSPQTAKGLTEMNAGRRNGLYNDYAQNKPKLGNVKLTDFAVEFAKVYNNTSNSAD